MDATIQAHELRRLAVVAQADPATCRRFLEGKRVRGLSALRIRAAMRKLKLTEPTREADPGK